MACHSSCSARQLSAASQIACSTCELQTAFRLQTGAYIERKFGHCNKVLVSAWKCRDCGSRMWSHVTGKTPAGH